jgi:hypothetical protein
MGKETFSTGNILKWKNRTKRKKLYTLAKRTNYNKPLNQTLDQFLNQILPPIQTGEPSLTQIPYAAIHQEETLTSHLTTPTRCREETIQTDKITPIQEQQDHRPDIHKSIILMTQIPITYALQSSPKETHQTLQ